MKIMYYTIYETTNLINGKKYRGMHQTETLNDGYLGSGLAMQKAIKKYGKENFTKIILEYCNSYDELIEQEKIYVNNEWVKDKNTYNLKTGGQSAGLLSDESKNKISETLKKRYADGTIEKIYGPKYIPNEDQKKQISETLIERYKTEPHNRLGVEPWNKDTKGLQVAWNKGIESGPMSEEHKDKISKTLIELYTTKEHHKKGVEPWNKGKKGLQEPWNKGITLPKEKCIHCDKECDASNLKRWHNDNCKFKNNQN